MTIRPHLFWIKLFTALLFLGLAESYAAVPAHAGVDFSTESASKQPSSVVSPEGVPSFLGIIPSGSGLVFHERSSSSVQERDFELTPNSKNRVLLESLNRRLIAGYQRYAAGINLSLPVSRLIFPFHHFS